MQNTHIPPPPVPQKLLEILKDYPEHIARLQDALNHYIQRPSFSMPFDGAIWALEGRLETFIAEARTELEAAEASGDAEAIQKAKSKRSAAGSARANMGAMQDLYDYIQAHREAFE